MSGCWSVMIAPAKPTGARFDAAFVRNSPLSWIARNSSKPGRQRQPETWVLHASAEWSEENLETAVAEIEAKLTAEFWRALDSPPKEVHHATSNRWRFALPKKPLAESCLFERELRIGACGDWCAGPRVEGAF